LEFNVPFQHKYGYIRDKPSQSTIFDPLNIIFLRSTFLNNLKPWSHDSDRTNWTGIARTVCQALFI